MEQRIEQTGSDRDGDGVVGEGEEKVQTDAPERAMANGQCGDDVAQVVLHQHDIGSINGNVCAASNCDAAICLHQS